MEEKVLSNIVSLLHEVQWLYDFPVTQIFTRDVLKQIPAEWCEIFEDISLEDINGIPEFKFQAQWPPSLKNFLERCEALSLGQWMSCNGSKFLKYTVGATQDLKPPNTFCKGLSAKKKHEVLSLVHLAKKITEITHCNCVLDVGSGMGYVDSLLHHILNIPVLGAESEETLVKNACIRQAELAGSCNAVKYINWKLEDDESTYNRAKDILYELPSYDVSCTCDRASKGLDADKHKNDQLLQSNDHRNDCHPTGKEQPNVDRTTPYSVMLLGLHSCADLSPVMMKVFKNCPDISSLVLLSCCYHKMKQRKNEYSSQFDLSHQTTINGVASNDSVSGFANFPLSNTLNKIMKESNLTLSVYGLRLAAQESGTRWSQQTQEDHQSHEKNVAYRALLEVFCVKEGYILKKQRRRCVRKSKFCDFSEYVQTVLENYQFVPVMQEMKYHLDKNLMNREEYTCTGTDSDVSDFLIKNDDISGLSTVSESLKSGIGDEFHVLHNHITDSLCNIYKSYKHLFPLIEPFTGLQLALQPVLEALVLIDRVAYLKECNFNNVWLERVFDEKLSPRSAALIAVRKC